MELFLKFRPKAVIFDCDGVLVDSERPMHEVLRLDLRERGLEITPEQCLVTFMGKSIEDVISTARGLGASLPRNWRSVLYERVHARLSQGVEIVPGVAELVRRLKANEIPFCVASNGSERKMELMLSQHGLWDDFKDRCFSAQTLGVSKPNPGLLRHALTEMGEAVSSAVVIEDSLVGVQSARNAGVPCLVYDPHGLSDLAVVSEVSRFARMQDIESRIFSLPDDGADDLPRASVADARPI